MAKAIKVKVKLESTAGTGTFYLAEKNPRTHPEKLSLKKYDKKSKKHEEEDYTYALALKRRNETDQYNNKKAILEKELSDLRESLLKREADLAEKEKNYESLTIQVEQIPSQIKEAVNNGYREIILSGIHLGLYGKEVGNEENINFCHHYSLVVLG